MIDAEPDFEAFVNWLTREYGYVSKTPLAFRHAFIDRNARA
jgi:hypothetical protein